MERTAIGLRFTVGLAFCGFVLLLAANGSLTGGRNGGIFYGYGWFVTFFQLVAGVLLPGAAIGAPALRARALGLCAVLTATCFLFNQQIYYILLRSIATLDNTDYGPSTKYSTGYRRRTADAGVVLFAGTVVSSVADALTLLLLGRAMANDAAAQDARLAKLEVALAAATHRQTEAAPPAPAEAV